MIIKEAIYKEKTVKRSVCVSDPLYGCDECKIVLKNVELGLTSFNLDNRNEDYHFCSWNCLLKHLPKIDSDSFINLPYIDCTNKDSINGLNQLIKTLNTK